MINQRYSLKSATLRDGLSVVFRRKRLVVTCIGVTLFAAGFAALFLPRYHGEAKILVDRARVDPVLSPTPEMNSYDLAAQPIVTDEDLRSEVELMKSTEVLNQVVREMGLANSKVASWWRRTTGHPGAVVADFLGRQRDMFWPKWMPWQPGSQQSYDEKVAAKVNQLSRDLNIEPARGSYIINVVYKSKDRQLAKQVLDKLLQVYIAKHTAVRHPPGEYAFFEQQTNVYRKKMEAAQAALASFDATNNSAAPAMDRDLTMQKLSEFQFSLNQTRAEIAATTRRIQQLIEQERSIPSRMTTQMRKADNPQLLEQLKSTLLNLELKRSDLLTKYQPNYRPVQDLNEQIAHTQAAIQHELNSPTSDVTTDVDPTHEMVRTNLAQATAELAGYKAREREVEAIVNNYTARARQLDTGSLQEASLQRDLKAAEDNYLLYLKKSEEARISDALDEHRMLNIAIAEYPFVPALPAHSPLFFAALALIAMLTASVGLIWSLERMDRTFHRPHEIEAYLGIPVLVSIPSQTGPTTLLRLISDGEQQSGARWRPSDVNNRESIPGISGDDKGAL